MDETSVRHKMQSIVDSVSADIASIRTGRATGGIVEDISVPAYGGQQRMKVKELASINVTDAQTIVIDPWDKSIIGDIKKGLLEANIGLNPAIDGVIIRLVFHPLTSEDKEKFIKLLSGKEEGGRVLVRQVRADAMKEIKKAFEEKQFGEDDKFQKEKEIQELTDEYIGKIEEIGAKKKQDLLQV